MSFACEDFIYHRQHVTRVFYREFVGLRSLSARMGRTLALTSAIVLAACFSMDTGAACKQREPIRRTSPGPHDYSNAADSTRLWQAAAPGDALYLRLCVLDVCGKPLAGARVQVLHANHEGAHEHNRWRGATTTNARGAAQVLTVFPGYTGGLPRHIQFVISHTNYAELVTRFFF